MPTITEARPAVRPARSRAKPEKVDFNKPPEFTLGWELEANSAAQERYPDVESGHDGSVDDDGMEYKTRAGVHKDPARSLLALRRLLSDPAISVNESCGFHVHLGLPRPSRHADLWAQCFIALAREVEGKAFEAVPASRRENDYCRAWSRQLSGVKGFTYHPLKYDNAPLRYQWVNVVEMFRRGGIRTVEVRLMGDSRSYPYLLAWTSFCRLMGQSAWRCMGDISAIQKEAKDLKIRLKQIKESFIDGYQSKSKSAFELGRLSGLIEKRTRPLEELVRLERTGIASGFKVGGLVKVIRPVSDAASILGRVFTLSQITGEWARIAYRGGWNVLTECLVPFVAPTFEVGDTVEVIQDPHDESGLDGGRFEVVGGAHYFSGRTDAVTINYGGGWSIFPELLKKVEVA